MKKRTLIVSAALAAMSALGGVKDGVPHIWIQHIIVPDVNCNGLFLPAKDGEGIKKPFFMPDGSKQRMKLAPASVSLESAHSAPLNPGPKRRLRSVQCCREVVRKYGYDSA